MPVLSEDMLLSPRSCSRISTMRGGTRHGHELDEGRCNLPFSYIQTMAIRSGDPNPSATVVNPAPRASPPLAGFFFPHPRMRDCLVLAGDFDIMAFWNSNADAGLIIWGQPWDLQNWELSEGFLRKRGWTVQECPELMQSTNFWRTRRGERRLPPSLFQLGVSQQRGAPKIAQQGL